MFSKYIPNDEMIEALIDKLVKINPNETRIRALVRLENENYDMRSIDEDSFRDGGMFLIWCLKFNRADVLRTLLSESMVQFWRLAQLKTLLWACLQ